MLGFFKNKKKDIEVNCPVCLREFSFKYNPDEITNYDYKYKEGGGFVYSLQCNFCDAEASIVQFRSGEIDTFDNKWMKLEREHTDEIDLIKNKILLTKEMLEKEAENHLKFQLKELEDELIKLERIFSLQVKKYTDFKTKWQKEWQKELQSK